MNILTTLLIISQMGLTEPAPFVGFRNGFLQSDEFYIGSPMKLSEYARVSFEGEELPFILKLNGFSGWTLKSEGTQLHLDMAPFMPEDTLPTAALFSRRGSLNLARIGLAFHRPFINGAYGVNYDHLELPLEAVTSSNTSAYLNWQKGKWEGRFRYVSMGLETLPGSDFRVGEAELRYGHLGGKILISDYNGSDYRTGFLEWNDRFGLLQVGMKGESPFFMVGGRMAPVEVYMGYQNHAPLVQAVFSLEGLRVSGGYANEMVVTDYGRFYRRTWRASAALDYSLISLRVDAISSKSRTFVSWNSIMDTRRIRDGHLFAGLATGGLINPADYPLGKFNLHGWIGLWRRVHRSVVLSGLMLVGYEAMAVEGGLSPNVEGDFRFNFVAGAEFFDAVDVSYSVDEYLRYRLTILAVFRG